MKKFTLVIFAVFMAFCVYSRGEDRSKQIAPSSLPSVSQKIISKNFGGLSSVTSAAQWSDNYSANFKTGQKLNFYTDGALKEAKASNNPLPQSILGELPANVSSYTKTKYGNWDLVKLEVKSSKIEIEFERNDQVAKLVFNKSGQLLKEKIKD